MPANHHNTEVPLVGSGERDPIAIIGVGCRLPGGVSHMEALWRVLMERTDCITDVPADRWNHALFHHPEPGRPRRTVARQAGFIRDIDRFDHGFFGLSPREAAPMDPQHRVLLEVAWEALEDAGLVVEEMGGVTTGVFMGISSHDYSGIQSMDTVVTHSATGTAVCMAANRISYAFNFTGPSFTVDTACSSSLVAIHQACSSIWRGESHVALAGGVNLLIDPTTFVGFSRLSMLSPDSRCFAFDARANGFVRSEGAGVIVLKPLSRAIADGDRVHAVVLGTHINQDGRSQGLTFPSEAAQERLLRDAYLAAGVQPHEVLYMEAHGTGTQAGDPVEAGAIGRVLGQHRPEGSQLLMGSVKTNVGHLESGAGMAGVIKAALVVGRRVVPPNLHFATPNPAIPLEQWKLRVPVEATPLPQGAAAIAGVNSFGFGGTNAHVILREPPVIACDPTPVPAGGRLLLPISARSPEALKELAARYAVHLESVADEDAQLVRDLCFTAANRRSHHRFRAAVSAENASGLRAQLAVLRDGPAARPAAAPGQEPRVGFVFTGQGSQWWAMARELLREEPVFRAVVERCDALLQPLAGWSLLVELMAQEADSKMGETSYAQPALFAVQAGLVALWRSWGVIVAAVVGHSVGEIAAAYAAGVLSIEEAVRIVFHRSRLMERASARGRMLAVGASLEEVAPHLAGREGRVAVAAINSASVLTLSGDAQAMEELAGVLKRERVGCRFLDVQYAFHSHQMDPVEAELIAALGAVQTSVPAIPIASTVTGAWSAEGDWDGAYWWRNLRQTVCFGAAMDALVAEGITVFVEVGPQAVLTSAVQECLRERKLEGTVVASLQKGRGDRQTLHRAAAVLYGIGVALDWRKLCPPGRVVSLPGYPWQRERLWMVDEQGRMDLFIGSEHPLLGERLASSAPTWTGPLDRRTLPYLADHGFQGEAVYPAAAYLEMGLAAGALARGEGALELDGIAFESPCLLPKNEPVAMELRFHPEDSRFEIFSRPREDASWIRNAGGRVLKLSGAVASASSVGEAPEQIAARLGAEVSGEAIYRRFAEVGLEYGAAFRGIVSARCGDMEALGEVRMEESLLAEAGAYRAHPALLDACFQVILAALPAGGSPRGALLPVFMEKLRWFQPLPSRVFSHVVLRSFSGDLLFADLRVLGPEGQVLVEIRGLQCRAVGGATGFPVDPLLYTSEWVVQARPETSGASSGASATGAGTWLLLDEQRGIAARLRARLEELGHTVVMVRRGREFASDGALAYVLNPEQEDAMKRLVSEVQASGVPPIRGAVHFWGLTTTATADTTPLTLRRDELPGCVALIHFIQALAGDESAQALRLWVVTDRAQAVLPEDGAALAMAQTPLWGLTRVAATEHARLRPTLIDLDDAGSDAQACAMVEEVLAGSDENEVALRGDARLVHRYRRTSVAESVPLRSRKAVPGADGFRIGSHQLGILDNLRPVECAVPEPGPGEVVIAVRAGGLNFADVLKALGLYPGATAGTASFGAECSGVITALGAEMPAECAHLRVGQEVVAVGPHCFGSFVKTPAAYVFAKPEGLSFEEAAAVPVAFLTAQYALMELGRLRRGERVLVHAASGGVGLSAIQIARRAGAEVIATAGSPEKRAYLRGLGVQTVLDSRSLDFADGVLAATGGEGVDVVLNSLAGEAIAKGISVLRPFGRFIEIGKRDIYANARLGLRPLRENISFSVLDLDQAIRIHPVLVHGLFRDVLEGFRDGSFRALPLHVFPLSKTVDAFRLMSKAQHIGKVVVSVCEPEVEVEVPRPIPPVTGDGSYLVVGGVEGFGRSLANYLVEKGARHLVFINRSGPDTSAARDAVQALGAKGCEVRVLAGDASDVQQLGTALAEIRATLPPLRGVVHAAMVLDDCRIASLDRPRMAAVLRPKVQGAWNLHQQTLGDPLDFFLMTSSIASVFGSQGQANYAAANAFLDGLAHYRRGLGRPALTLNLGAFDLVGHLTRYPRVMAYLANMGFPPMPPTDVLAALDSLLGSSVAQLAVARLDFERLVHGPIGSLGMPRFRELLAAHSAGSGGRGGRHLAVALAAAAPAEREGMLRVALVQEMSRVLGVSAETFDASRCLNELGLDSLMSVELTVWAENALGLKLATVDFMRNPSTADLAGILLARLEPGAGSGADLVSDGVPGPEAGIAAAGGTSDAAEAPSAADAA